MLSLVSIKKSQEQRHATLNGKTVIVTGSASGMGRGMAERFSSEGANVVLCDVHEDKLTEVAKTLPQERTLALRCDVTDFDAVRQLVPRPSSASAVLLDRPVVKYGALARGLGELLGGWSRA